MILEMNNTGQYLQFLNQQNNLKLVQLDENVFAVICKNDQNQNNSIANGQNSMMNHIMTNHKMSDVIQLKFRQQFVQKSMDLLEIPATPNNSPTNSMEFYDLPMCEDFTAPTEPETLNRSHVTPGQSAKPVPSNVSPMNSMDFCELRSVSPTDFEEWTIL